MSYYSTAQKQEAYGDDSYNMNALPRQQQLGGGGYRDDPYGDGRGSHDVGYAAGGAGVGAGAGGYGGYPMSTERATSSSPYTLQPQKKKRNKWLWVGLPLLILAIIIAAVVGGVVGSRKSSSSSDDSTSSSGTTTGTTNAAGVTGASTSTGANGQVYLAVATDSYMLPVYPTATATSGYSSPTVIATAASSGAWPADPSPPSTASPRSHPRIIAPQYKWDALPTLIPADPYMKYWNETIFANASATYDDPVEPFVTDGGLAGSGILDPARRIKLKVKNWAYAYRMSNDTKWAERSASSSTWGADNSTKWNPSHFLDVAELTSAFAISYDWLFDYWTTDRQTTIRTAIITYGLNWGLSALTDDAAAQAGGYQWWTGTYATINGNWNCVCNAGLTIGALAIMDEDTTGVAAKVLALTVPNAMDQCMLAVHSDGTWAETANYWYFGTTGAAELVSALNTTYGTDMELLENNSQWNLTSLFHMYVQGMTSLFNYGDHGPNKYSSTANSLMLWGEWFDQPRYTLYQRDQYDASEPWSMFWYNPAVSGAWWDGLPLDNHFDNYDDDWAAARSSWSDNNGTYFAIKSGSLQGHQTHGDIDIGDFVLDALGQRWAGELGSGQYLAYEYFESELESSQRWVYYRKRTEGQNTIVLDYLNQNVLNNVTSSYGSTGDAQGPAPGWTVDSATQSTAFYTTDMTQAYNGTSILRGIRFINSRTQILLQDDVTSATADVQWRMHSNATMTFSSPATTATLTLGGQTLEAVILSPSNATFTQLPATRYATDPDVGTYSIPDTDEDVNDGNLNADQPNYEEGVYNTTVLAVTIPGGGTFSLQVLFNPQYTNATGAEATLVTPPSVSVNEWTTTSHNT